MRVLKTGYISDSTFTIFSSIYKEPTHHFLKATWKNLMLKFNGVS